MRFKYDSAIGSEQLAAAITEAEAGDVFMVKCSIHCARDVAKWLCGKTKVFDFQPVDRKYRATLIRVECVLVKEQENG